MSSYEVIGLVVLLDGEWFSSPLFDYFCVQLRTLLCNESYLKLCDDFYVQVDGLLSMLWVDMTSIQGGWVNGIVLCCERRINNVVYVGRSTKSMVCGPKGFNKELCEVHHWWLGLNMLGKGHWVYLAHNGIHGILEENFLQVDQPLMST